MITIEEIIQHLETELEWNGAIVTLWAQSDTTITLDYTCLAGSSVIKDIRAALKQLSPKLKADVYVNDNDRDSVEHVYLVQILKKNMR
jgi:hypothetical protein